MADSACPEMSSGDEKPVHYTLKIQSFSLLKDALVRSKRDRFESQIFNVGGYKWKLALYPNGDEKRNKYGYGHMTHISLYLVFAEDNILSTNNSEVNVVFTFLVYDHLKDKYFTFRDGKIRRFHAMKTEWGFEKLIPLSTFNNASNGFLVDDCCAFGVDIFVKKCDDAGKGEILSLIKQPKNYKYIWKLNNFSQLDKNCYESDHFNVESYRWKISLYPKGYSQAKPGFLSLYLHLGSLKELPQGSQVYVEYEMAVLSQLQAASVNKTYTFSCWFGFGGVGVCWGSPEFLSLRDLKEPTKGFILNDTIVVEVKINVISTFKKIESKGNTAL